jgi:hypothetical protein
MINTDNPKYLYDYLYIILMISRMNVQANDLGKQSEIVAALTKSDWKTIGVRIKSKNLPQFNRRLSLYGFETLGALVADFLAGKFPVITEDRQIQSLDSNL